VKTTHRYSPALALAVLSVLAPALWGSKTLQPRQELSADARWKFCQCDAYGAEDPSFNDSEWRDVDLPHDWSIEGVAEAKNPTGGGGGYFPSGIGWYRKNFTALPGWKNKRVTIEFDGVAANATVYINGRKLGFHPYAYTSFRFDITPQIDFTKPNILAVRVDNSEQPNSRWYTGAGIYRHVRIVLTEPIHVAPWGVFVGTPAATFESAKTVIRTELQNESRALGNIILRTTLVSPDGVAVGKAQSQLQIAADAHQEITQEIPISHPKLWSPETPVLYRAITELVQAGTIIDQMETTFGVRTLPVRRQRVVAEWSIHQTRRRKRPSRQRSIGSRRIRPR
jgi:beta-galactosidase